jgi:hypothetical protein
MAKKCFTSYGKKKAYLNFLKTYDKETGIKIKPKKQTSTTLNQRLANEEFLLLVK